MPVGAVGSMVEIVRAVSRSPRMKRDIAGRLLRLSNDHVGDYPACYGGVSKTYSKGVTDG